MKRRHVSTLYWFARRLAQCMAFAVFCCLPWLTALDLGIRGNLFALDLWGLPFADPAGALQAMVCGGGPRLNALLIGALLALLVALVLGRVFCSWLCPYGLLSELAHSLARLCRRRPKKQERREQERRAAGRAADRAFWGKVALLVCCILVMALWGVPLLGMISLPGELSLLPLLVWLGVGAGLVLGAAALPLFALSAEVLTGRRLWCRFVCPQSVLLGAAAHVLPKKTPGLRIAWRATSCSCKKERPCAEACALGLNPRHAQGPPRRDCTLCGDCLKACAKHGGALAFGSLKEKETKSAYLEQLLVQVARGKGGSGDYTEEKYESPSEDLEKICAELDAMAAARRRNRAE